VSSPITARFTEAATGVGRVTKHTRACPLGINVGMQACVTSLGRHARMNRLAGEDCGI
jgi:hypothetical protein